MLKSTSPSPYSIRSTVVWAIRRFALWVRTAPFDGPVVPDVKRITDASRGVATAGGRVGRRVEQLGVRYAVEGVDPTVADHDHPLQRLEPRRDPLDALEPLRVDHERARSGRVQHVREHVASNARVERHLDDPGAGHPEPEPEVLGPVAEHDRGPVSGLEPEREERVRDPARALVELPEGDRVSSKRTIARSGSASARAARRAPSVRSPSYTAPPASASRQGLELAQRLGAAFPRLEPPHAVRVDLLAQQAQRLGRGRLGDGHAVRARRARSRSPRAPPPSRRPRAGTRAGSARRPTRGRPQR